MIIPHVEGNQFSAVFGSDEMLHVCFEKKVTTATVYDVMYFHQTPDGWSVPMKISGSNHSEVPHITRIKNHFAIIYQSRQPDGTVVPNVKHSHNGGQTWADL